MKIPDQNTNQLIVDTHYYKWLKKNNILNVNFATTKREYLDSLGIDKISEKDYSTLKNIEQFYAHELHRK